MYMHVSILCVHLYEILHELHAGTHFFSIIYSLYSIQLKHFIFSYMEVVFYAGHANMLLRFD